MSYLANAAAFLIQTVFGLAIGLFLIRMLLIAAAAPFNNPACRFVYSATNPVVMPLRRFVPRWRRIEFSSFLVACVLALLETALLASRSVMPSLPSLLLRALVRTLDLLIWIELIAILAVCVLSFIPSARHDANVRLLSQCTEPLARPFRRLVPSIAGLDLSYWFASIALILVQILIIAPLADFAARIA